MTASERDGVRLPDGLHLIDLPQPLPGFRRFISSWFFRDAVGRRILVDPGPADTIPFLLRKLAAVTDGVDLVLLTHIHLDHSGGLGQFCRSRPEARVLARIFRPTVEALRAEGRPFKGCCSPFLR